MSLHSEQVSEGRAWGVTKSRQRGCAVGAESLSIAAGRCGFTLVELLVALALAAVISVSIMFISTQARSAYQATVRKVEVTRRAWARSVLPASPTVFPQPW